MKNDMFELSDCKSGGFFDNDYKGKVLVLSPDFLKSGQRNEGGQLWLGVDGAGCEPGDSKKKMTAVHLISGETAEFWRGQFYGVLPPHLLPKWAKLMLGSLPVSGRALEWNNYTGYILLPDESYGCDVPLADWQDVLDYIKIQKDYQHSIEITESKNDTVIAYVKDGWCRIDPNVLLTESYNLTQSASQPVGLKLKDALHLAGMDTVYIAHDTADVGFISLSPPSKMSEKEREYFTELLNADIKEIRAGAYGTEIVLTGVSPQALINYDRAASGHEHLIEEDQDEEQGEGQGESIHLS